MIPYPLSELMTSDLVSLTISSLTFITAIIASYYRQKNYVRWVHDDMLKRIELHEATDKTIAADMRYECYERFVQKDDLHNQLKEIKEEMVRMNELILKLIQK